MRFFALHRKVIRIQGDQSTSLGMMRERLMLLACVFAVLFLVIAVRIFDLGFSQGYLIHHGQLAETDIVTGGGDEIVRRGYIYDRNGVLLATSIKVPALFADPSLILEPEIVASELGEIFPDLDVAEAAEAMRGNNEYTPLVRPVSPEQQARVLELGQPGLGFEYKYNRVYPNGDLVSHIVGYAGTDGHGMAGAELGQDEVLYKGENVYLSLDVRLQHALRRELSAAINEFKAIGAAGAVLDIETGEILASVSLPDFDPNFLSHYKGEKDDSKKFNRMTQGVYELGSVFKVFSIAAYLDLKSSSLAREFDVREPLKIGRFRIKDYHPKKRDLSIPEIFIHSSNIGTALMAEDLGADNLKGFYKDLGLMNRLVTDIAGSAIPDLPDKWSRAALLTVSYGHGISVSPLQVLAAFSSVVNDGLVVKPSFMRGGAQDEEDVVRLVSKSTSEKTRKMLRLNALYGSAMSAEVSGFYVGGKTGTANKSGVGGYRKDARISTFVGAFPMHDPKYAMIITVDEPRGHQGTYGYATAGWVSAPVFARMVKSMAVILGIQPDENPVAKQYSRDLEKFLHPDDLKKKKPVQRKPRLVSY